jgi:hypothetical protein
MTLVPLTGFSQVALAPSRALSVALARSDARLDDETRRTVVVFEQYRSEVQGELAARNEEIRQLRELLIAANARPAELDRVHAAEIAARDARIEVEVRNTAAARQETVAAVQLGEQHVAAEHAARVQAEQAVAAVQQELLLSRQETAAARTETAQREIVLTAERNAAVFAATQRGDARVAAERQTMEEMRVRDARLTELIRLEGQDTCRMQKVLHKLPKRNEGGSPRARPIIIELEKVQELIDVRLFSRPRDSVKDSALQEGDTQKLASLAACITRYPGRRDEEAREQLLSLIAERRTRIR